MVLITAVLRTARTKYGIAFTTERLWNAVTEVQQVVFALLPFRSLAIICYHLMSVKRRRNANNYIIFNLKNKTQKKHTKKQKLFTVS